MTPLSPFLVVFGGLPGTGKTTIAREVANRCGATYLRIDVIEHAIRAAQVLAGDIGSAGYLAAYALAGSNLKLGRMVIADCVNPLPVTREAWRAVAKNASSPILEIEIVCSNAQEHRRRVETRVLDIPGFIPPTWAEIETHTYEPWVEPRMIVDTALVRANEAVDAICAKLEAGIS